MFYALDINITRALAVVVVSLAVKTSVIVIKQLVVTPLK